MIFSQTRLHLAVWLACTFLAAAVCAAPAPPEVLKLDPPSWWAGHSLNPVRLLIRGRNLHGAQVGAANGVAPSNVKVNEAGTYLFVDLTIAPEAKPGRRSMTISTPGGTATAEFELLPPLPRQGRFQGFSSDDFIYLIMPDRFANGDPSNDDPPQSRGLLDRSKPRYYHGGDLQGVIDHLPYLKDLGVTALWLTPIYDNNNRLNARETYDNQPITDYHGYGAVDFYAVEEHLGTLEKFRELVDAAHRNGIKVIQDQVANHTGPYHPWAQDSPTPTWYNGTEAKHLANTWQTWTLMDPHATAAMRRATLDGWFINILPDLNQDDEETARYLIQNTLWWIGTTGIDGIRQDTLPYVPRRFWSRWMSAIKHQYPRFRVVGELFDGDPALVSFFQGGRRQFDGADTGVDALFDFPLFFPLRRAFAQGGPLREAAMMLARDHLYPHPERLVTFAGLHDVARFMNEQGATAAGLKLAFTLLLTARGIPMVYYGDEIAMRGGGDPDNRRDFPGGWPGDAASAFTPPGRTPEQQEVFEHLRALARLRASSPALRRGTMTNLYTSEQQWVFARVLNREAVIVAFNNATEAATIEAPVSALQIREGSEWQDEIGGGGKVRVEGGALKMTLPARSASIYRIQSLNH